MLEPETTASPASAAQPTDLKGHHAHSSLVNASELNK